MRGWGGGGYEDGEGKIREVERLYNCLTRTGFWSSFWFYRSGSARRMILVRSGREHYRVRALLLARQSFFPAPYKRTVLYTIYSTFSLTICYKCILCWSSCRGQITSRLRQGYVGDPFPPYRLSFSNILSIDLALLMPVIKNPILANFAWVAAAPLSPTIHFSRYR